MASKEKITIIGAGLVGSLYALQMAKRGHEVQVFEKRPDMRKKVMDGGRSINLIVTSRGLNAARRFGIEDEVVDITVPVTGRMIHDMQGETKFQPYGRDDSECNYSISRGGLNKLLMELAEAAGVQFFFESELLEANFESGTLKFSGREQQTDLVIGADGVGSATRNLLMNFFDSNNLPYENRTEMLGADYKELLMPLDSNGNPPMEKNALHIWPRGSHMLMALPNLDGSFTMTVYLPVEGDISFGNFTSEEKVQNFANKYYSSALPHMPDFGSQWQQNPVGALGTVRCNRWVYKNKVALIGDAAHGIVPFFGQGMNSGFEDCTCLDILYDKYNGDFSQIFKEFEQTQVPNATAIADMAIENYTEMQDKVGDNRFLLRKALEHKLENTFPKKYRSRYGMVTYTLIPYSLVKQAGLIQEEILSELLQGVKKLENVDMEKSEALIDAKLSPFLKKHNVPLKRFI